MTDELFPPLPDTSVYPSSRPSQTRKFLVRGGIALVVLALLGGTGFILTMKIKFADFQPPMAPANVVLTPVESYVFVDRIEAIGTVTASESAAVTATVTETPFSHLDPVLGHERRAQEGYVGAVFHSLGETGGAVTRSDHIGKPGLSQGSFLPSILQRRTGAMAPRSCIRSFAPSRPLNIV